MLTHYLTLFKTLGLAAALGVVAYYSYDYGVTSTQSKAMQRQNVLLEKVEQKQDEAFTLAVKLATQKPDIRIQYREIEKKVIHYAQNHRDKQCVSNDNDWLLIRSESVRAHNRALGVQPPAPLTDGTASATHYQDDAEVLAEDVANLQTCTENAQQLLALQTWLAAQLPRSQ